MQGQECEVTQEIQDKFAEMPWDPTGAVRACVDGRNEDGEDAMLAPRI